MTREIGELGVKKERIGKPTRYFGIAPRSARQTHDRVPADHEGRNSWLLNYGIGPDVDELRKQWEKISGRPFPPGDAMTAIAPKA